MQCDVVVLEIGIFLGSICTITIFTGHENVRIPVTRVTENYVWFQNKALSDIYSQGKLDRITGTLHFFHRHLNKRV